MAMSSTATTAAAHLAEPLAMFIVVRRDLLKPPLCWPVGSVIAQGAHAATSAMWTFKDHPSTCAYTGADNLTRMTKVVYELKNESQLRALAERLVERGVDHVVWREQPEDMVTALATRPYRKSEVGDAFKKCSLFR